MACVERVKQLLLVEDDALLARVVREYLMANGYVVDVEDSGLGGCEHAALRPPDLMIVGTALPDIDGFEVCRRVRQSFSGPILVISAGGEDVDEIVALELGADDFVRKPLRPRLLLARVRSLLRRASSVLEGELDVPRPIRVGALLVDPAARAATVAGKRVELTCAEFELLWLLVRHAGEALSRDRIYRETRGIAHDGLDRSIDRRVSLLRTKLGDDAREPMLIKSVRGVGYLLAARC